MKNSKLVSFPSGGKTKGNSGTRTTGQAVLFKLRMGLTLTQVTKLRKALQGARKNEQIKRKKKDFFKTLMSFITSARDQQTKQEVKYYMLPLPLYNTSLCYPLLNIGSKTLLLDVYI